MNVITETLEAKLKDSADHIFKNNVVNKMSLEEAQSFLQSLEKYMQYLSECYSGVPLYDRTIEYSYVYTYKLHNNIKNYIECTLKEQKKKDLAEQIAKLDIARKELEQQYSTL